MARTPAAQAFGELGERGAGEWRGIRSSRTDRDRQMVVPPALVVLVKHAKCREGEVSSAGESFFLVCFVSTHPDYPVDDRMHFLLHGV